ncbi:sugar phosphate isomerase/epimerase family protein [Egicoccus sp. AB-alg2]|uniref:sugar phosphate isomerase/epimerase family protein n=1 Tax=Egicoccus sp. AB-alg2 TaxID=3242693 RepID=UPI00359ED5F0
MPITNLLGVHALVWTAAADSASIDAACRSTAAVGYDLLEVPLLEPAEVDPVATRASLGAAGITASCSLGLDFDTDISSTDAGTVERGARLLIDALEVTSRLGADYLGGPIYSAMGKYTRPATTRGRANAVRVLRELASEAATSGVTIGLEPVNRYESNVLNTVDQALALIDEIGADNLVVHLDTYHANIEERAIVRAVHTAATAGRLGYVHVGESHRGHLGTGSIVWEPVFAALGESDYRGPIVFESFSSAVVSPAFAAALGVWRDLWTDSHELAGHAHDYLTRHLTADVVGGAE